MKTKNSCIKLNKGFLIAIVFLFVLISAKIVYISVSQYVDGVDIKAMAIDKKSAEKVIRANRGNIYDSVGEVLAQDVRAYTVIAYLYEGRTEDKDYPRHVVDKNLTAEKLSTVINMSKENILALLNKNAYQVELGPGGRNITELKKQEIEKLDLPGIDFTKSTKRDYPYGDFASYIIGYARKKDDEEIAGEMGIELKYNENLKGEDGILYYQKDAYGYQIANTKERLIPSVDGYDIHLTIDSNIQMYVQNALMELSKYSADWATMTVADAKTGAIVASGSYPSFDPNIVDVKNYNNPLTSFVYEPGSTMKEFSFMAAIEHNLYKGDELYPSGTIEVDEYLIKDWNTHGWGEIDYDTGFTYSSNTATVRLAQRLGKDKLMAFYEKLGFGSKTNIELPGELEGSIQMSALSEIASAAYGQGISTTPVQQIQALTSITNNGVTLKPYVISKIENPKTGEIIYEGKKQELNKVVSTKTINKIKDLMDETVNGDDAAVTGSSYKTDTLTLIGKTGTAQYISGGKYTTASNLNIKSFTGIFPKENPEYIIYVSVKDFGGATANLGKITSSVVESIAKYRNLDERESDKDESKIVTINNLINKSKEEAKTLLENKNLTPVILGDGNKVIKQYPIKNTKVTTNTKVFLLTNSDNILMPDINGWNSSEAITLLNMINISYNINGYGKVAKTSKKAGELITKEDILTITLSRNGKEEDVKEETEKTNKEN